MNLKINKDERIILLQDDINEEIISEVYFQLLEFEREDSKAEREIKNFDRHPIRLFINSSGGSVEDCISLVNLIENMNTPIYTYTTGYIYSSALDLFLTGEKRFISNDASALLHSVSSSSRGNYTLMKSRLEKMKQIWDIGKKLFAKTKISEETLKDVLDNQKEYFYSSDEMLDLGIATDLIEKNIF